MNLREIIDGWNHLGSVNQIGFIIGLVGTIATVLGLAGIRMHLANLIIFIFFCGFCMLFYGNVQQSKKLAKAEEKLGTVNTQIDHATQAVYTQKNDEIEQKNVIIRKLEIDVATWKDRTANCQEKLTLLAKDFEIAQREHIRADKLYSAFIRMRYLYKDAIHMTTRDLDYGMSEGQVKEESQERFRQMDPHDLYMEADCLSKEGGVPDDA